MRVHLAADHAGFELKSELNKALTEDGHQIVDHGAVTYDAEDDYPSFCIAAALAVGDDPGSLGVVIGGSGNGEQIAANKVRGIRAALIYSKETAQLSREHNDAQIAGIGARMHSTAEAIELVRIFVGTPFSGADRHLRRIDQVAAYEAER